MNRDSVYKIIGKVTVGALAAAVLVGIGYGLGSMKNQPEGKVVQETETSQIDLKLPGEKEKRVTMKNEVESRIRQIGECATYCGEYSVSRSDDEARSFIDDLAIPGTTNTISMDCKGIVKVGYDLSDIKATISEDTISVSIPKAKINDNYIIWESVQYKEKNSILNPIEFDQYKQMVSEIEAEGLADVEAQGIYEKAEENLQKLIRAFLDKFDGYQVVFTEKEA